jgi:PAS domain S-box-containing protein
MSSGSAPVRAQYRKHFVHSQRRPAAAYRERGPATQATDRRAFTPPFPALHRLPGPQYSCGVLANVKRRVPWERGLKRDLVRQTADYLFVARAVEGLAAWVLFNESGQPDLTAVWPVHLCFLSYFVVNAALCLYFRRGDARRILLIIDLANNLGTMLLAAALTGGVLSPVVLICLLKIAGYLLVFSTQTAIIAIRILLAGFGTLVLGEQFKWWNISTQLPEPAIDFIFRIAALGTLLAAAPRLLRVVGAQDRQLRADAARARGAAEKARAAHGVVRALLDVSEAVSRLTQLGDILNKLVEVVPRVLSIDYCGIFLWSEEHGSYQGKAVAGVEPSMVRQLTSIRLGPKDVPDFEWVRQLGHSALVAPRGIARLGLPEAPAFLMAPLISGSHFYGVLQVGRLGGQSSFTQNELIIADGVASQAAVALERARLVEESHRFMRAVESTDEAVLITDPQRRIVSVNQALLGMFGYTRDELLGCDSLMLGAVPDDMAREVQRAVIDHSWRGEARVRRKDGSTFPIALHASLIRSDDDRIQGAVAIIEDMTAQKQLQEQMQRADRLAAAGEIAAGVAHEVNNALVGILGQAELARAATDVGSLRSALANVELQGVRIAGIVQELLGLARRQPPQRTTVDLRTLVSDTLTLMAHDLGRNRIRSQIRFAEDLPSVSVDAKQIQQVLVNLFTNAMQAMQPDGGALSVAVQSEDTSVSVQVQDTGAGIAPEALSRVFDPFFSTKQQGTGLGLSVSYGIAQAHGGDLTVESTLNEGTTFTLRLPATRAATGVEPRTVLLVDDDDAVADTLREMLEREGLRVRRAETGKEALLILAHDSFDAVFLDVRLPDISGPQIYERLVAMRPEQARRVVFVTGGLWRVDSRGLREKLPPGQPTLSKPCTAAQIGEVLRLLRDTRAAA